MEPNAFPWSLANSETAHTSMNTTPNSHTIATLFEIRVY